MEAKFLIIFPILFSLFGDIACHPLDLQNTTGVNCFHNGNERIVNGRPAKEGELPYQLSLRSRGSHICGAVFAKLPKTLDTVILTAAHCVRGKSPSEVTLMGGSLLVNDQPGSNVQILQVQEIAIHKDYNPQDYKYDIAVLFTTDEFKITDWVSPIALSLSPDEDNYKCVAVSGWGRTREQPGTDAEHLQVADIPIVINEECAEKYKAVFGDAQVISEFSLCAGLEMGGVDSCQGDSGGPAAFWVESKNEYVLGGLTSWGEGCARPNLPGVYTRVSYFVQWIQEIVLKDKATRNGGVVF